jgi:hypothetical protein
MPKGWRGWGLWLAAQAALTFILKLIYKLAENAMLGWGDDQIATALGITSPTVKVVIEWGIPFCSAIVILAIYHFTYSRWGQSAKVAPEIDSLPAPPGPVVSAWDKAVSELRDRYIDKPGEIDEDRGFLDYSADGFLALQDITNLANASTAETEQLTEFMAKVTASAPNADLVRRRDEVSALADFMNGYSVKMQEMANLVRAITSSMRDNQMKIVEQSAVTSNEDYKAMKFYVQAMRDNSEASGRAVETVSGFRNTLNGMKGVSSALNKAIAKLSPILGNLSNEFENYRSVTAALAQLCSEKLATAEKAYGSKKISR